MIFGDTLLKSYRELWQSWARIADSAFGRALPEADEMARGEFISAFICDPGSQSARKPTRHEIAN